MSPIYSSPEPSVVRRSCVAGEGRCSLVHIIPDLDPRSGGTVAALVGLAIAQRNLGCSVFVITTSRSGSDNREIERLRRHGVNVVTVGVAGRLRSIRLLGHAFAATLPKADSIHIHAVWEEIQHQACCWARKLSKPYLISPHGMLDPWSLSQGRLKKQLYLAFRLRRNLNGAAAIHCTTRTEARLLEPLELRAPKIVIPNGIDLSEFDDSGWYASTDRFIDDFPEVAGKKIILFLSRLHPKKGLDLLLPAFALSASANAVLVMAGPGDADYIAHLRREVKRLNLEKRVIFTGMLHAAARVAALRAADLYVLPSYQENFGIAVVEALAAGTPVIISDQVNLAESIQGSSIGEVVPTEIEPLAVALQSWLADPSRRREAGRRGKAFVKQYAFDTVARQWADHFTFARVAGPETAF